MTAYRRLEKRLIWMRWLNGGHEAPEEEGLLEEMTEAWMNLDDHEQVLIRKAGPKTIIARAETGTTRYHIYEPLDTSRRHRVLKEVA